MDERGAEETGLLAQEAVYAGLGAVRSAVPVDLCAYLHVTEAQGPQLFLGTPDLSSIDPTEAFNLFAALRDALESETTGHLSVGRYRAVAFRSRGTSSRGLHVLGRLDQPFGEEEQARLETVVAPFAAIVHGIEHLTSSRVVAPSADPVRVAVEMSHGSARAEVAVPRGDEVLAGAGEAPTAARAVALAVIDAVDAGLKLVDATEGEIAGERAVLVLVRDDLDRAGLGSSLVGHGGDVLAATASATIEATTRARV